MKMALKVKKEGWLCDAPPSPKPKPEQRLWRPRWQHWKVSRDAKKKKKDPHVTHLLAAQDTAVLKAAQISPQSAPGETSLTTRTEFSLTTESATKTKTTTCLCSWWCRDQQAPDQAGYAEALCHCATNVNTLIRPGGERKAYILLPPEYAALVVANKIGISWVQLANSKYKFFSIKKDEGWLYL